MEQDLSSRKLEIGFLIAALLFVVAVAALVWFFGYPALIIVALSLCATLFVWMYLISNG